jgi:heptosyltransferase-3
MTFQTAPKPVVIYRLGSLGDTIVALPCFHAIARKHPGAERVVLTNFPVSAKAAPLEGILGGSGLMSRALAYPVGTRSLKALWTLRKELRGLGADTLYYLTPARGLTAAWRDWVYFKLCGFRHVIGTPLSTDLQVNRTVNAQGHLEHEALRLARCLDDIGPIAPHNPSNWDLRLLAAERERAQTMTGSLQASPYLAINMGGKVAINDWGMDNWLPLLQGITRLHPQLGLLVVGGPEDHQRGQEVAAIWQGPIVNACGALKPRESAAAMAGACQFIGHDSGPMHLAAAMGVPCVGLFGNNNPPGKWHPYGPHHLALQDMRGVRQLTVEQVSQAVLRRLPQAPRSASVA